MTKEQARNLLALIADLYALASAPEPERVPDMVIMDNGQKVKAKT